MILTIVVECILEQESEEAVRTVLKNKRKLKDAPASELREIFLRQSKTAETLVAERNQELILREMGICSSMLLRCGARHTTRSVAVNVACAKRRS